VKEEHEQQQSDRSVWPKLASEEWKEYPCALHMWTQIVGKLRWFILPCQSLWNVNLFGNTKGVTTGSIPTYPFISDRFDFIDHQLLSDR